MKRLALTALVLMLALPTGVALAKSTAHRHTRHGSSPRSLESGKPVLDWNQELLSIVNTPGAQPATIQPTWSFAMMHAAIYDAVNSIDRSHRAYMISVPAPRGASETAAADAAAHRSSPSSTRRSRASLTRRTRRSSPPFRIARQGGWSAGGHRGRARPDRHPRRRRRDRRTASVRPRNESRRLPSDPAEPGDTGLHDLGAGHALRARERQPVPARTAARADEP